MDVLSLQSYRISYLVNLNDSWVERTRPCPESFLWMPSHSRLRKSSLRLKPCHYVRPGMSVIAGPTHHGIGVEDVFAGDEAGAWGLAFTDDLKSLPLLPSSLQRLHRRSCQNLSYFVLNEQRVVYLRRVFVGFAGHHTLWHRVFLQKSVPKCRRQEAIRMTSAVSTWLWGPRRGLSLPQVHGLWSAKN